MLSEWIWFEPFSSHLERGRERGLWRFIVWIWCCFIFNLGMLKLSAPPISPKAKPLSSHMVGWLSIHVNLDTLTMIGRTKVIGCTGNQVLERSPIWKLLQPWGKSSQRIFQVKALGLSHPFCRKSRFASRTLGYGPPLPTPKPLLLHEFLCPTLPSTSHQTNMFCLHTFWVHFCEDFHSIFNMIVLRKHPIPSRPDS